LLGKIQKTAPEKIGEAPDSDYLDIFSEHALPSSAMAKGKIAASTCILQ